MRTRILVEIDITAALGAAITRGLNWEDQVNYVLKIVTDDVIPFTGITECYAVGGFENVNG